MKTLGAVLAGGRSSRFGSDKALAKLGERTLLDHAQAALAPYCDALAIVGGRGVDQLLTISVDCVRLPLDLRALLEPAPAFLYSQPVIGLWPLSALNTLRAMLEDGSDIAVRAFARRVGARAVESDFVVPNVNSVADPDRLAHRRS